MQRRVDVGQPQKPCKWVDWWVSGYKIMGRGGALVCGVKLTGARWASRWIFTCVQSDKVIFGTIQMVL